MEKTCFQKAILALSLFAFILSTSINVNGSKDYEPDFEYPLNVITHADSTLNIALRAGDTNEVIASLIQYSIAKSSISEENVPSVIMRVDSIAAIEKVASTKAILYSLEAEMYSSYYRKNMYKNRNRDNNTDSIPSDITEWNKEQFSDKIFSLIKESLIDKKVLQNTLVATYKGVIEYNEVGAIFRPTIYDFIAYRAMEILYQFSDDRPVMLARNSNSSNGDLNIKQYINKTLNEIIKFHEGSDAPYISAQLFQLSKNGFTLNDYENLLSKFKKSEFSGEILIAMSNMISSKSELSDYYVQLNQFAKSFPNYIRINNILEIIKRIAAPKITISNGSVFSRQEIIEVNCISTNLNDFTISIYRIPDGDFSENKVPFNKLKLIVSKSVKLNSSTPSWDTTKVVFPPLEYGKYIVLSDYYDKETKTNVLKKNYSNSHPDILRVTDIHLIDLSNCDLKRYVIAVDSKTGAPIGGVTIKLEGKTKRFITDKDGKVNIPNTFNGRIYASKGKDIYSKSLTSYQRYSSNSDSHEPYNCNIFSDLGVYSPGDSIKCVAVCYSYINEKRQVVNGERFKVVLANSNGEVADSVILKSDNLGRITSSLSIPKNGLNGNHRILVLHGKDLIGGKNIEVSEYKAPSFYIEFTDLKPQYSKDKEITINGVIKTYSQVPLSNTTINCTLSKSSWFWSNEKETMTSFEAQTNNSGQFSITIPDSVFVKNNKKYYMYNINVSATSTAGETQENSGNFSIGNARWIRMSNTENIIASKTTKLPVTITTSEHSDTLFLCKYTLTSIGESKFSTEGTFKPSAPIANLERIPSGEYKMSVSIIGDTVTEAGEDKIIIYRPTDKTSPIKSAMWVANTNISCDENSVASVLIGNSPEKSSIYYVAYSDKKVVEQGWVYYETGMHQLNIKMPQSKGKESHILLFTTKDFNTIVSNIVVTPSIPAESVTLTVKSFRNKIVPGTIERWSFSLKNNNGIPVQGAFMAEMYDKSLNAIANNDWALSLKSAWTEYCKINYIKYYLNSLYIYNEFKYTKGIDILYPTLNTYGMSLYYHNIYFARSANKSAFAKEEYTAVEQCEDAPSNGALCGVGDAEVKPQKESAVQYRTNDVKCGLWEPLLCTDKDGNVSFEFNVPNENTTWLFQAIAYTTALENCNITREAIANKPIMVQPNLPRFLRHGDKATIKAQILNSTDSITNCDVIIELFNPENKNIIQSQSLKTSVPANGTTTFATTWNVPDSIAFIGYRIKAETATFGDGEQSLIAILPATSPVIESKPFFLEQNDANFSLTLPKYPKDSRITLEYCDNPVWYCVTALPTIQTSDAITATGLVRNLYCNLMAKGIVKKYPFIDKALKCWNDNPKESALISLLAKNEELKNVELSNTPWLSQSQAETLQMEQLTTLFNKNNIENASNNAIKSLKGLQKDDGGWSWYHGCESDTYTTYEVMQTLGELRQIGYLEENEDIKKMILEGVKYLDKNIIKIYDNEKETYNYSEFIPYIYVRSFFKDIPLSTTLALFKKKALKEVAENWKGQSMADKAFLSLILNDNGDVITAKAILESIRQFAITKPATGMYWDNLRSGNYRYYDKVAITSLLLRSFHAVEPQSKDIDLIRKWLLLQKQTTNWGSSTMASDAIYSLLKTGSNWIDNDGQQSSITVNNNKIIIDSIDSYTGYVKQIINLPNSKGNSISITRNGNNPAWGSVFCQYNAQMSSIKSVGVDGLTIEKSLYIQPTSTNGKSVKSNTLQVGDKVKVQFLIKSSKDLDFVNLTDERCASIEPVNQLSGVEYQDGIMFYRELKNSATNLYIAHLPKGTHIISYDVTVTSQGQYSLGIATIQCQYAPQMVAHSSGTTITVK
ncbi:MAG: alpha-2-macroglobulin family protein [Muribaculaceae bacterium]